MEIILLKIPMVTLEQYYADLQKKEASILWIECQHLEDLSKEEIYNLLKSSMDSFLWQI